VTVSGGNVPTKSRSKRKDGSTVKWKITNATDEQGRPLDKMEIKKRTEEIYKAGRASPFLPRNLQTDSGGYRMRAEGEAEQADPEAQQKALAEVQKLVALPFNAPAAPKGRKPNLAVPYEGRFANSPGYPEYRLKSVAEGQLVYRVDRQFKHAKEAKSGLWTDKYTLVKETPDPERRPLRVVRAKPRDIANGWVVVDAGDGSKPKWVRTESLLHYATAEEAVDAARRYDESVAEHVRKMNAAREEREALLARAEAEAALKAKQAEAERQVEARRRAENTTNVVRLLTQGPEAAKPAAEEDLWRWGDSVQSRTAEVWDAVCRHLAGEGFQCSFTTHNPADNSEVPLSRMNRFTALSFQSDQFNRVTDTPWRVDGSQQRGGRSVFAGRYITRDGITKLKAPGGSDGVGSKLRVGGYRATTSLKGGTFQVKFEDERQSCRISDGTTLHCKDIDSNDATGWS